MACALSGTRVHRQDRGFAAQYLHVMGSASAEMLMAHGQVDARVTAVSYAIQELSNLEHFIRTTQPSRPHAEALTVRPCMLSDHLQLPAPTLVCYCMHAGVCA